MIEGKIKQETELGFSRRIGLAEYTSLGVNLSYPELKAAGFYVKDEDLEKEREFVKDKEGVNQVQIEFALKEVKPSGASQRRVTFYIEDKDEVSKNSGAFQWINDKGQCSYADTIDNLQVWFTGTDNNLNPRKAKAGEELFMEFMRNLMLIDFKSGGTIKYDLKKMFNGNFKEIKDDLKSDYAGSIIINGTIKLKDITGDDGEVETREYESFYNRAFAPGKDRNLLNNKKKWSDEDIQKIKDKMARNKAKAKGEKWEFVTEIEKLLAKVNDDAYPCKDLFYNGLLKDYDKEEYFAAKAEVLDKTDSSY